MVSGEIICQGKVNLDPEPFLKQSHLSGPVAAGLEVAADAITMALIQGSDGSPVEASASVALRLPSVDRPACLHASCHPNSQVVSLQRSSYSW